MRFHIITIFPKIFDSYFGEGMLQRAKNKKLLEIKVHNLRDFTNDRHQSVDDTPYGGGAGMLMKIEPLYKALKKIKGRKKTKVFLLSAKGQPWKQKLAQKYAKEKELILICGRYEGVDERLKHFIDEEVSIGPYVLTGGEIGAMALVDSIGRLIPGVLGNKESSVDESHSQEGLLEYPQYTKPAIFKVKNKKLAVPEVLLSGNHEAIKAWREKNKKKATK